MRVVLDTNVLVAAMRSPKGASARLVAAALHGEVIMVSNVGLFTEYEAVMTREEHLRAAGISLYEALAILDELAAVVVPASWVDLPRPQLRDRDDDMVLEAAVGGGADAIVTSERRTFAPASAHFGISVLTPGQACGMIAP